MSINSLNSQHVSVSINSLKSKHVSVSINSVVRVLKYVCYARSHGGVIMGGSL